MKTKSIILLCFVMGSLFSYCRKENNNKEVLVNRSSSPELIPYRNSLNPYDSVGIIHNDACYYLLKILDDDGCILTDGETDTVVTLQSLLLKEYEEKWQINVLYMLSLIDDYLYLNGYTLSERALSSIFDEDYVEAVQNTMNLTDSIEFIERTMFLLGDSFNSEFMSEIAYLIYNEDNTLSFRYSQSKDRESVIMNKPQHTNEDIMQLIGLSVFRHSTHLWSDVNNPIWGNNPIHNAAPLWVASDLTGAMNAWWFLGYGGWFGVGMLAGYVALCSVVAAIA